MIDNMLYELNLLVVPCDESKLSMLTLPVALPHRRIQRRCRTAKVLRPIPNAAVVLAPCHLAGVCVEVAARKVVVRGDLSPAKAAEETLRLVRAGHDPHELDQDLRELCDAEGVRRSAR